MESGSSRAHESSVPPPGVVVNELSYSRQLLPRLLKNKSD